MKIDIPDQTPYPEIATGEYRAKLVSINDQASNERIVFKFKIGYAPGGSGFTKLGDWKDNIKFKNTDNNPTAYTDAEAAYRTNNSTLKTFLEANLPAGFPKEQ